MEPLSPLSITLPPLGSGQWLASLHGQLRAAILDGRLKPGLRLPSTRALAQLHGVSRNCAIAAYDRLLGEGYVVARRGSGTVVALAFARPPRRAGPGIGGGAQRLLHPYWRRAECAAQASGGAAAYAFRVGVPDAAGFPYQTWRCLAGRVLRRWRAEPVALGDPQGLAAFRQAIASHVSFTRAVACAPEDIIVTAGAQQAFDLLARILAPRARATVAIENPGYAPLRAAFQAHGAALRPVPVDEQGMVVARIPASARVVCVTPSHQFPLGCVLSAQRRAELLERCQRQGAVVIEDDYDGEFRFGDRPLDALQTLDRSQSVFYVGTFSKTLLPDLRLGYIVAPAWAVAPLIAAKSCADGACSSLLQATVSLLISEGHLARHVRRMLRVYRRRREVLLAGLDSGLAQWLEPLPSIAGLHIAARLRTEQDERSLIQRAARHGAGVHPLQPHFVTAPRMRGVLLGFGAIGEQAIAEGLLRLRRALLAR